MKKGIILISLLVLTIKGFAQVDDYFFPSEEHFNKTFRYKTDTWENENGRFYTEHIVRYFYDRDNVGNLTGNIKRHIQTKWYRYNVITSEIVKHEFYNSENNIVRLIHQYTEGISDELKNLGLIRNFDLNRIALKYPPHSWEIEDDDIKEFYKTEFGELTTEYGKYPCIIVTKTMKAKTENAAFLENYITKYYYAKDIGLVKTETYDRSGNLIDPITNFGSLIDNFSSYSFSVLARKEQEERELQSFLLERKSRIYNYQELAPDHYNSLKSKLERDIKGLLNSLQESVNISLKVELNIDTLGITTKKHEIQGVLNSQSREKINSLINDFDLNRVNQRNYAVFAQANYSFSISHSIENLSIKKTNSGITFLSGDNRKFQDNQQKINETIGQDYPFGQYQISINETKINSNQDTNINVKGYSSFGGPSNAFASILVPGLGKRYVTGGEQKGLGVTFVVYSLVGGGVASKYLSNINYDKYHTASTQSEMDNHYDLANNLNKATYFLIGAGALIWLHDIYWVANRGSQNKKNAALMNQRINLSFGSDFNNNLQFGLTINF
jgi:hypothetical protein